MKRIRRQPFSFDMVSIPVGAEIEFCSESSKNSGCVCRVYDDKRVIYDGKLYSLTGLAKVFFPGDSVKAGPSHFKYKGVWLDDIRKKLGV